MEQSIKLLVNELKSFELDISEYQIEQFIKYYEIMIEKNKVMNLTSITEINEVIKKHFVDSLSLVKAVDENNFKKMIDVGTGAGFPGIPIKIMFPKMKTTLVDSLNKRIEFLNEVINKINLEGVTTIHGRAEDIARQKIHREEYDLCVSRAVANLAALSEYCLPFIKIGGSFICYKAGNCQEEISNAERAISILGGKIEDVIEFKLPDSDISRTIVVINKIKSIPNKYPRKAGTPTREPLV